MSLVLPRRVTLGAGALLGVLLLVVAAAGVLAVYYTDRADSERRAEDREAGRVFALWFMAAHRASMETHCNATPPDASCSERLAGGAFLLTPAELRGLGVVPPGLPGTVGRSAPFSLGIIDDGNGVPMAFGVVEPEAWAHTASLREGALEGGLVQIEDVSGSGSEMHGHVAAIETALGRTAAPGALFVTADRGVRYGDRVLYRRAQPGQPRLNRMETDLNARGCGATNADPCDVLDAGAVGADELVVSADGTVGGTGSVATDAQAATLDVTGLAADPVEGTPAYAGDFTAVEVSGPGLAVTQGLVVGSAVARVGVTAADMTVTGHAQAASVTATTMTGQDATATTSVGVTGTLTVATMGSSTLTVSGSVGVQTATLVGLYGPSANIRTLTVDSCAGCYPP